MLLLRLIQGIFQGATMQPYTHFFYFFGIFICVGKGHYASASNQPEYIFRVPPCHLYTKNFIRNCQQCGKGAFCFCFDLARVFLQGAPCNPYTKNNFWFCHYCGKVHYASASAQPRYISGCTMTTLHPIFYFSLREGVFMLLLRLSQFISSGCRHDTYTQKIWICHLCGKGAFFFCFNLAQVILQDVTMPPLNLFLIVHYCGKGIDIARLFLLGASMPPLHL